MIRQPANNNPEAFAVKSSGLMVLLLTLLVFLSDVCWASYSSGELLIRLKHAPMVSALDEVTQSGVASLDSMAVIGQAALTAPLTKFARRFPEAASVVLLRTDPNADLRALEAQLTRDPNVEWVTRNYHYRTNDLDDGFIPSDSLFGEEWWLSRISAPQAWELSQGDSTIVIGIIDTGIDFLHPDLRPNIWFNWTEVHGLPGIDDDNNGFTDDSLGWDFVDSPSLPSSGDHITRDSNPYDEMGHGTYVAGIAAAVTDNETCLASIGYHCRVMCLRAGNAEGLLEEDDIAAAILYGAQMGARIINMSFGDVVSSPLIRDAVRLAAQSGVVLAGSAGNANSQSIHYPSGYPEVISVGATNTVDQRASFSNYGPSVDIMAPGYNIVSLLVSGGCGQWSNPHGTSYAVPMVAAVAGLMIHANPDLTPDEIKQIIRSTADDLSEPGWDDETVNGRLNARRAVEQAAFGTGVVARITSPRTDDGYSSDISVIGDAWGSAFTRWDLLYGLGENPVEWNWVNGGDERVYGTLLGEIALPVADTVLNIRLESHGFDGSLSVDHVHLYVQRSAPIIDSLKKREMLDQDSYGELVQVWTNQVSGASMLLTNALGDSFREDFGYVAKAHSGMLSQLVYSGAWTVRVRLENAAGFETLSDPFLFEINKPSFSSNLWSQSLTGLTHGYLGPFTSDFNRNGDPEVWRLPIGEGGLLSDMEVYEWSGSDFTRLPYTFGIHLPQAVGDADEDGLLEFMARRAALTRIWEQHDPQLLPDPNNDIVFEDTSNFIGAAFLDLDSTDGHGEILARRYTNVTGTSRPRLMIFSVGDNYALTATDTLPNESGGGNELGPPVVLVGDLDRDEELDFVYGDYDGDIIFCERAAGRMSQQWTTRLPLGDATAWLAAGDFDGDGSREFAAGCRENAFGGTESQRKSRHWEYYIFECTADNQFAAVDSVSILGNEDVTQHPASVAAGDIDGDGQAEILISAYPDYYVIARDPVTGRYEPRWYASPSESNTTLIADLSGDGINDALYSDGMRYALIESAGSAGNRPAPPFALNGEPLSTSTIRLNWRSVAEADSYRVYRAEDSFVFQRIAATLDTVFTLSNVPTDIPYTYAVTSLNADFPIAESVRSNYITVIANEPPAADDTARFIIPHFVQVKFSEVMGPSAFLQRGYRLEDGRMPSLILSAEGGRAAALTFDGALSAGWHSLELRDLRDAQGSLLPAFESPVVFEVVYSTEIYPQVLKATVLGGITATTIEITFSEGMSSSVMHQANYRLDGPRRVERVDSLSAERSVIRLHLDPRYPIGALGVVDTLWLSNIAAMDGRLLNATGETPLLLGATTSSITNAYVYPNPYRRIGANGETGVMFAGLPERATIRIFTLQGIEVCKIEHDNRLGGSRWDLRNEHGDEVAGGVYLYTIEAGDDKIRGKLAILR